MNRAHEQVVDAQFGPRAKAYVDSAVHARGPDLEALEAVVSGVRPARALDLGTGGGHVAYLMARYAGSVTASDLSPNVSTASPRCFDQASASLTSVPRNGSRLWKLWVAISAIFRTLNRG